MTSSRAALATADLLPPSGGGRRVIRLAGELDSSTAPLFAGACRRLDDEAPADVVIDLTAVTFFDSSALSVLAALHGTVAADGRSVLLHGPSPAIRRVLAITRMDEHFVVVDAGDEPAGAGSDAG